MVAVAENGVLEHPSEFAVTLYVAVCEVLDGFTKVPPTLF